MLLLYQARDHLQHMQKWQKQAKVDTMHLRTAWCCRAVCGQASMEGDCQQCMGC
jgi:hypothetical protein